MRPDPSLERSIKRRQAMRTMRSWLVLMVAGVPLAVAVAEEPLPKDVAHYVERRDLCDHFRGEEPYDPERREFLARQTKRYCEGTDKQLAALKKKYQKTRPVLSKLGEYEANIEIAH